MAEVSHSQDKHDITAHPDVLEMRERYEKVLGGASAVAVDGLVLLAGLYLAISPWAVDFAGLPRLTVINLVAGLAVAVVGLSLSFAPSRVFPLSWALIGVGAWEIVAPWVVGPHTNHIVWNNVVTGAVIAGLGVIGSGLLAATRIPRPRAHLAR